MKKTKLAIFKHYRSSHWASCVTILNNMLQAYGGLPKRFEVKTFDYQEETFMHSDLGKEIERYNPHILVFADHWPHPLSLIKWMLGQNLIHAKKQVIFHLYGDYTFHYLSWHHTATLLKNHKVKFIVSSERQKQLVRSTFRERKTSIEIFPFLVDTQKLSPPANKFSFRKRFRVAEDEICFLYTGRISLQKNIQQLIECFAEYCRQNQGHGHLFLAGAFDDLGLDFFNRSLPQNFYYHQIAAVLKSLPKFIRKRIHFLGKVSFSELLMLYREMDIFLSLSLYHDEDFGMSPAEALCSGMPAILTDWGGYHSFRLITPVTHRPVRLIPVHLKKQGLYFDKDKVVKEMFDIAYKYNSIDREKLAKHYCSRFGIKENVSRLSRILSKPPEKFSGLKELDYMTHEGPRFDHGPTLKGDYKELYENYATGIQ